MAPLNHTSLKILAVSFTFTVLLVSSETALAWHWEGEDEYARYYTYAGDPRVVEDAGDCLRATAGIDEVECTVLYWHLFEPPLGLHALMTQRVADCRPEQTFNDIPLTSLNPSYRLPVNAVHHGYEGEACDAPPNPYRNNLVVQYPFKLDDSMGARAHLYLRADGDRNDNDSEAFLPGAMPCLSVRMRLISDDGPGAEVIGEGQDTKTVITSSTEAGLPLEDPCPDSTGNVTTQEISEFVVDFKPQAAPVSGRFHLEFEWFQWDGNTTYNTAQRDWTLVSSPQHQNRVILPTTGTLQLESLLLDPDAEPPILSVKTQSVWGTTDVDPRNVRIQLFDAEGNETPLRHVGEPEIHATLDLQNTHGHYPPANTLFPWHHAREGLEPGDYTLRATVTNWQHSVVASGLLNFTLHENNDLVVHVPGETNPARSGETDHGRDVLPYAFSAMVVTIVAALLSVAWLRRHRW